MAVLQEADMEPFGIPEWPAWALLTRRARLEPGDGVYDRGWWTHSCGRVFHYNPQAHTGYDGERPGLMYRPAFPGPAPADWAWDEVPAELLPERGREDWTLAPPALDLPAWMMAEAL